MKLILYYNYKTLETNCLRTTDLYIYIICSKIYFTSNYHELGFNYRIEFIVIINQFITDLLLISW